MKKLCISLIFSKLVMFKQLATTYLLMLNFVVKFGKILDIIKEYAENRVNNVSSTNCANLVIYVFGAYCLRC